MINDLNPEPKSMKCTVIETLLIDDYSGLHQEYKVCNGEIIEVGASGVFKSTAYGNESIKLYQCEQCKTIKLI